MLSLANRICLTAFTLLVCAALSAAQTAPTLEARRKALSDLLAEQWEYRLRTSPLYASFLGDKRWNAELDDFSQAAIEKDLQEVQKFVARFELIDTTGFPKQEVLNKRLIVRDLKAQLEGARFKPWEMPVDQQNGVQVFLPQLVLVLSFQDTKDYQDYISRLRLMPRFLDQTTIQMKKGMADKLMPPRFILDKVVGQADGIATQKPSDSPFAQPFKNFPKSISEAEQTRLREQGIAAIRDGELSAVGRKSHGGLIQSRKPLAGRQCNHGAADGPRRRSRRGLQIPRG